MKRNEQTSDTNEEITINKDIVTRRVSAVTQSLITRFLIGNRSKSKEVVKALDGAAAWKQVIQIRQKRKLITVWW